MEARTTDLAAQRSASFYNGCVYVLQAQLKRALVYLVTLLRAGRAFTRSLRHAFGRLRQQPVVVTVTELARRTFRELGDDFATDQAASVSYYALLSLFPLAIGLVSLFSLVMEAESVEREVFDFFHTYLPGSEDTLVSNVKAVESIRGLLGLVSVLGLVWSASLLFGAISRAVNRAWDVPYDRPFLKEKPRHFIMAFSVAPLFVLSMVTTTGLQLLGNEEWPVLGRLAFLENDGVNALARPLPFLFSLLIFLLLYKFAPYARTHWRYIWPGALVAALLFDVTKSLFVFYLENYASYDKVYGVLAAAIVLMAWAYLSGLVLMIGAEVASEYQRIRLGLPRGQHDPNAHSEGP